MRLLEETIQQIRDIDRDVMRKVQNRWDNLYLGMGDLGKLTDMVVQYAGITGEVMPEIPKCCMVVACADHGVAKQQVSAYPVSVTASMTKSYLIAKGASANALGHYCGADMVVADMGVASDLSDVPGLRHCKIAWGTADLSEGPAMTREQAIRSIETGITIATEKEREGYKVFTVGEMGIANTTSSACLLGAFNGWNAEEVTGRGTNISDERLRHKVEIVQKALDVNRPNREDGLDVFAKLGGFEYGCLVGVILGAAAQRALTIIDGFNSTACAFVAKSLCPTVTQYMMSSHLSLEQAHKKSLQAMGLAEYVDLDFRLGEAVGASIQKKMLDIALSVYREGTEKGEVAEA